MDTFTPPPVMDHVLLARTGKGAYGEVWLARSALGRLGAVKVVHRQSFTSDRPYEREFTGTQRFEPVSRSHEGLVDILHEGRSDDAGFFYYLMELADLVPSAMQGQTPASQGIPAKPSAVNSDSLPEGHVPRTILQKDPRPFDLAHGCRTRGPQSFKQLLFVPLAGENLTTRSEISRSAAK